MLITPIYNPIPPLENLKILTNDGRLLSWTDSPILVSATFSDPVIGVLPTAGVHFATKEYVDLAGLTGRDYWLSDTDDRVIDDYHMMYPAETGGEESTIVSGNMTAGDGQLMFSFITEAGEPGFTQMRPGVYRLHTHLNKGTGDPVTEFYWTLTKRLAADPFTETLLMTSEISDEIDATTPQSFETHAALTAGVAIGATDRLVLKFYGNVTGGGTSNVTITMEGLHDCHLSIQAPSSIWQNQGDVLDDLNALGAPASDGQFIVATGAGAFQYENPTTARASLRVGVNDTPLFAGLVLGGNPSVFSSAHEIHIKPSNDDDDYITFSTPGGVPTIGVVGAPFLTMPNIKIDGTLLLQSGQISDSGGEIVLDDNTTINGTLDCGAIVSTGAVEGTSLAASKTSNQLILEHPTNPHTATFNVDVAGTLNIAITGGVADFDTSDILCNDLTADGTAYITQAIVTIDDGSHKSVIIDTPGNTSAVCRIGNPAEAIASLNLQTSGANPNLFSYDAGDPDHLQTIPAAGFHNYFFEDSADGENKHIRIYGFPSGESKKYGQFKIVSGTTNPRFKISTDGEALQIENIALLRYSVRIGSTVLPTVALDVTGQIKSIIADAAGVPCLTLDQDDISEGCIDFLASARGVITGATNSAESVRVELNGTVYRIALYADA